MTCWKSFYVNAIKLIQYFRVINVYHLNNWLPFSAQFPAKKNNSAQLRSGSQFKLNYVWTSLWIIFYVSFPTKYFTCSVIYILVILYDLTYWEVKQTVEINLITHFLCQLFNLIILRHKERMWHHASFFQVFINFFLASDKAPPFQTSNINAVLYWACFYWI